MHVSSQLVGVDSADWAAALGRVPHDVYHRPEYAAVDAGADGRPVAFVHREDEDVFLLPLVLRPVVGTDGAFDAVSPYGYPGPVATTAGRSEDAAAQFWCRAVDAMTATLRAAGVVSCFVRLSTIFEPPREPLVRSGCLVMHGPTVAVDLTLTAEKRWSATRSNHRRQINRARREGISTVVDDWDRLPAFVAIYHDTMRRVGADDFYFFSPDYFDALRDRLSDHLHLVVAQREDGDVLAGGLFFENDGIVQYHLGATRDDALPQQPMKLVLVDAMAWGASNGARVLHLGGGVGGEDDPLLHFKVGFSAWQLPYGTWRVVVDPGTYRRLAAERAPHVDPTDLTTFFPAYREQE